MKPSLNLKMLQKVFYLLLLWISLSQSLFAQSSDISFGYDEMGNRVRRNVVTLKSAHVDKNSDTITDSKVNRFEEDLGNKKIIVHPNPTKGQLLVEIQGYEKETESSLYLYNLSGKLLKTVSPANANVPLDMSQFPAGIYILKIKLGEEVSEWKIIKE